MRLAMIGLRVHGQLRVDEVIDERRRRHRRGRARSCRPARCARRRRSTVVGRHRHHRIEVARGQRVGAGCRGSRRGTPAPARSRRAAASRAGSRVPSTSMRALAFLDDGADAGRREDAAEPVAAGADALDQRALRHELDFDRAGEHLLLRFGIEPDVADDRPCARCPRVDELADADARQRRVVGDHGEVALALPHQLVDQTLRACRQPMKPPIISVAPSGIAPPQRQRSSSSSVSARRQSARAGVPGIGDRQRSPTIVTAMTARTASRRSDRPDRAAACAPLVLVTVASPELKLPAFLSHCAANAAKSRRAPIDRSHRLSRRATPYARSRPDRHAGRRRHPGITPSRSRPRRPCSTVMLTLGLGIAIAEFRWVLAHPGLVVAASSPCWSRYRRSR